MSTSEAHESAGFVGANRKSVKTTSSCLRPCCVLLYQKIYQVEAGWSAELQGRLAGARQHPSSAHPLAAPAQSVHTHHVVSCLLLTESYWIRNAAASPVGRQVRAAALSWEVVDSLRSTPGSANRHRAAVEVARRSRSSTAPQRPGGGPVAECRQNHTAPAPPPHCPPVSTAMTTVLYLFPTSRSYSIHIFLKNILIWNWGKITATHVTYKEFKSSTRGWCRDLS